MIYLKNNTDTQIIFIPKEAIDSGGKVVVKHYDEGVEDGIKIGEQRQKDKLLNVYITESGEYQTENGYGLVTVDIDVEAPSISLEKGHFTASENGEYAITPTEGFDGLESLNLTVDVQCPDCDNLTELVVRENGVYEGAFDRVDVNVEDTNGSYDEGYNQGYQDGQANCEGGDCNLEDKWITPSMGEADGNGLIIAQPSDGFDGLSRVVLDPNTIYNEGVEQGRIEGGGCVLEHLDVYENGYYEPKGEDGNAPFDGYSSVNVNIDVELYKEEGRNEIRNELKTLSVNETGVFDINETFVKEVFVMNNAKIVGAKSSDNWENIKIQFAAYTLTPEEEWLPIQHLFRLSNGLEINFHGGGIRVENSEQGNMPYNSYPNFNEVEVTNNSFRVNDQIQYFDYDLFEGADYNIWLGNMRETIISVELNGISLSKDDFHIQEGSIQDRVLTFKKFGGEGWNKVDVTIPPISVYRIFAEFDDNNVEFFPLEHEKHLYYQFNGGGKSLFAHSKTGTYPNITDIRPNSFNKNDNVKEISLDVLYVGEGAFKDWRNLEKLTIEDFYEIKADAFSGCSKLKEIHLRNFDYYFHPISTTAFTNIAENGVVYVRTSNIENFVNRFYEIFPQSWTYVIE